MELLGAPRMQSKGREVGSRKGLFCGPPSTPSGFSGGEGLCNEMAGEKQGGT